MGGSSILFISNSEISFLVSTIVGFRFCELSKFVAEFIQLRLYNLIHFNCLHGITLLKEILGGFLQLSKFYFC